jgi:hypothetical protein
MRFAALRARTGRFSRSYLAAGLDPGGFARASTSYVCGAKYSLAARSGPGSYLNLRLLFGLRKSPYTLFAAMAIALGRNPKGR